MASFPIRSLSKQAGKSALVTLLMVALFGYGVFIAIQYIPQWIEKTTVESILDQLAARNETDPFTDQRDLEAAISGQLNVNQMNDMRDNFKVTGPRGKLMVTVDYERDLNLLYTIKTTHYHDELSLD